MQRLSIVASLGALVALAHGGASGAVEGVAPPGPGPSGPNVVIILSDDQRWDTTTPRFMPNLNADLVPNGITYTNAFVPTRCAVPPERPP